MKTFFALAAMLVAPFTLFGAEGVTLVPLELDTKDSKLTKIVLLAGEPSSKPGQHEYLADCALMFDWLKQTPGVWPVLARTSPTNEAIFDGAKSIVVLMD